jgi:hypothetical protein
MLNAGGETPVLGFEMLCTVSDGAWFVGSEYHIAAVSTEIVHASHTRRAVDRMPRTIVTMLLALSNHPLRGPFFRT